MKKIITLHCIRGGRIAYISVDAITMVIEEYDCETNTKYASLLVDGVYVDVEENIGDIMDKIREQERKEGSADAGGYR